MNTSQEIKQSKWSPRLYRQTTEIYYHRNNFNKNGNSLQLNRVWYSALISVCNREVTPNWASSHPHFNAFSIRMQQCLGIGLVSQSSSHESTEVRAFVFVLQYSVLSLRPKNKLLPYLQFQNQQTSRPPYLTSSRRSRPSSFQIRTLGCHIPSEKYSIQSPNMMFFRSNFWRTEDHRAITRMIDEAMNTTHSKYRKKTRWGLSLRPPSNSLYRISQAKHMGFDVVAISQIYRTIEEARIDILLPRSAKQNHTLMPQIPKILPQPGQLQIIFCQKVLDAPATCSNRGGPHFVSLRGWGSLHSFHKSSHLDHLNSPKKLSDFPPSLQTGRGE